MSTTITFGQDTLKTVLPECISKYVPLHCIVWALHRASLKATTGISF